MAYRYPWSHLYDGYQPPLIPTNHNEAIREIGQLEKAADVTPDAERAIDLYQYAISICKSHNFTHRAAVIHCKRAELVLKRGHRFLHLAIEDADESIQEDPDYLKGYHLSGLARQKLWSEYHHHPQAQIHVALAVQHFVIHYQRTSPQKKNTARGDLCAAIILAVDSGNTSILNLPKTINGGAVECTAIVRELVSMKDCSCNHLRFVIVKGATKRGSGVALELGCNLSQLDTSKLFEKSDVDLQTLQAVVKLGGTISFTNIEKAVEHINDDKALVFEYAVSTSEPKLEIEALTSLCEQTLSLNKPKLSAFLLSRGASPDSESLIKAVNMKDPNDRFVSCLLSTPHGCSCLLEHSLSKSSLSMAQKCLDESCTPTVSQEIDLSNFLKSSKDLLCLNPDLLDRLLETGANRDGLAGTRPIDAVLALPKDTPHKMRLLCALVESGADLARTTYPRTQGTTIFHIAVDLAIEKEDAKITEMICRHYNFPEDFDDKVQATNKDGQTPYHLIMQRKQSDVTIKLCEILAKYPINPSQPDSRGRRPLDKPKSQKDKGARDRRVAILTKTAQNFQAVQSRRRAKTLAAKSAAKKVSERSNQKKGPHKLQGNTEHNEEVTQESMPSSEFGTSPEGPEHTSDKILPTKSGSVNEDTNTQTLKNFIQFLSEQSAEYFVASIDFGRQLSSSQTSKKKNVHQEDVRPVSQAEISFAQPELVQQPANKQQPEKETEVDVEGSEVNKDSILANFESLEWEVEFPENVVKYFKAKSDDKTLRLAIRKIQHLATGIPTKNRKMCKRVRSGEEIYETHVTKAIRIIWEVATQFSPALTSKLRSSDKLQSVADMDHYLYSEVIRIWDVVEDHDNLRRSIDLAVKRIRSCRQRGEQASTKVCLLPSGESYTFSGHADDIRYPQVFTNRQLDEETKELIANQVLCCPAGSAKDDEYNVITFYPFDLSFVKSILEGEDARRDFPYKEWPKEHDIINMKSRSILLLGRSGTGKTTCCLYRLWNCFINYWSRANETGPFLDASPLTFYAADNDDDSDSNDETSNLPTLDSSNNEPISETKESQAADDLDTDDDSSSVETIASSDLEHLHQVFITKNYVLCAQMKKRFYDLAAGSDITKNHMPFEDAERSTSFSDLEDLAYPLFLTAREFFLLLDNSLGDNNQFFARNLDGKLTEKIRSSDYDHEDQDTLLDLDWDTDEDEESESESSDDEAANPRVDVRVKQPQRREVTASYFVKEIWPNIHHGCEDKKTDPLLVWMEIKSFIKGSRQAVESKEGYLTQDEYTKALGKKMAANFVGNREEIYEVFKKYQHFIKHRAEESLFDECEFIHNLFGRLCKLKVVPFSIHSFYVDEVQDFTQAELSILLRCCKDPNNLFLTGDTAQSIMRGVSFRFSDLRSLFHKAKKQAKNVHKKAMVTVPVVDELTINFRSHSGVLELAASIIDILLEFFPNSFDRLPGDKGMFPGPIPTLLDSCNFSDLALVLRGNRRESSAIEFGAHQVIIVQSEDAKKALPNELQAGIALTVFEAKGLEFDDVLLYDFFKDSKVSKEWRVVTEFIRNNPKLLAQVESHSEGFENNPRPLKFDEQHHKSLSAELKYLYTAITRAKCNLWIYDSDEMNRLPMFDYWHRRGLVKIVRLNEISQTEESALFAATSTKEEWKKQGDYFKKKKLWEPAMKCYVKAEEVHLEKEAKAYSLVQQARAPNLKPREVEELYFQAALAFLECDKSKHDVKLLRYAASFLKKAKQPDEAGLLYTKLSRHKDAVREFKKSKNFKGLVLLKEQEGNFNDAVSLLVDNGKEDEALECAERYENGGQILRSDLLASTLAVKFAKEICDQVLTRRNISRLAKFVKFMDNPIDRVNYLKIAKKHRDAFNILCNEKKLDEAYRICAAQGWAGDGLKLAEEKKNVKWILQFTFQEATTSLINQDKIDGNIAKRLHSLKDSKESDPQVKAKASLLLGKSDHDFFSCRRAFDIYLSALNVAGCIESFNLMTQFRVTGVGSRSTQINIRQILDVCGKATEVCRILDSILNYKPLTATQERTLSLLEEFYGLQRRFSVADKSTTSYYFLVPNQHMWVNFCADQRTVVSVDSDGMIQIDRSNALKIVSGHIQAFLKRWQDNDELQVCQRFRTDLGSYQFQKELEDKGCVKKSYKMSYEAKKLYEYLKLCYGGLELYKFSNGEIKRAHILQLLINFLKPAAAVYLGVTWGQMENIAKSPAAKMLAQHSEKVLETSDHDFHVDNWLDAWSILSILGKDHLSSLLKQLDTYNAHARLLPANKLPATYIRTRYEDGSSHIFSTWIRSCFLIQRDRRVVASSKVVLHYFLQTIVRQRSMRSTISVTSLINILTIHSTALLTLTALCNFMQHTPSNVLIPNSYERVLNVFDNVGKQADKECTRVLDACMRDEKVLKAYEKMRTNQYALQNIQREIIHLLWQILDLLLGRRAHYFHPLKYAMKSEDCVKRGEARHCLLLVLVLFGNLTEIDKLCTPGGLQSYHTDINSAMKFFKDSVEEEVRMLKKAYDMFSSSRNTTAFFLAISHLITVVDTHDHIVRINIQWQQLTSWKWALERVQMRYLPVHPLLPAAKANISTRPPKDEFAPDKLDTFTVQMPPQVSAAVNPDFEWAVPSHPASAVQMSSNLKDSSKLDQQQNIEAESISNTTSVIDRDPIQVLTAQKSEELHEEEDSTRLSFEEMEDEDLKSVTLSAPLVLDRQSSGATAQEDDDSATNTEDTSMVDEQFCRFCGVPLRVAEAEVPTPEQEDSAIGDEQTEHAYGDNEPIFNDQVEVEVHTAHRTSERHLYKVEAHKEFSKIKKWYYEPLTEALSEILQDLKRFENENTDSNLRAYIQQIESELQSDDRRLNDIQNSAEWKVGASLIEQDMFGRMEALVSAAKDNLSKERTRVQQLQEVAIGIGEDKDDEYVADGEDESQSDEEIGKKVDAKDIKEKERRRKREKKKQDKNRGKRR